MSKALAFGIAKMKIPVDLVGREGVNYKSDRKSKQFCHQENYIIEAEFCKTFSMWHPN
jgi:hypothetical protein